MKEYEALRLKADAMEMVEGTGLDNTPTQSDLKFLFDYDKNTGIFTRKITITNNAKIGEPAGYRRKDGYISIGINGVDYLAHRLAWLYVYGEWPSGVIDHKD